MNIKKIKNVKKTRKNIISLSLFCFLTAGWVYASASNEQKSGQLNYGSELDALPYLTGGYYLSGWIGKNNLRIRGIVASVNIPEFAVKTGFEDNKLKAYALVLDYFPGNNYAGIWYGGGIEQWDSEIKAKNENSISSYNNLVLTAGGGYIWFFNQYFYLNPWAAVHGIIDGDRKVPVGSKTFKPEKISAEISLKIGFKI